MRILSLLVLSLIVASCGSDSNSSSKGSKEVLRVIFDTHQNTFKRLPDDPYKSVPDLYKNDTLWYTTNYNVAKYNGYQDLLEKYDYHVPSGRGLTILQAESNHTPDDVGDVKHLFNYNSLNSSNKHSQFVASILTFANDYPDLYTRYRTFSENLDSFHAATTADLRTFFNNSLSSTNTYPAQSYDGIPLTPAKLVNVSNTNGGSSSPLVKQFDKFVEENDMVACTAQSSLPEGNWTTSGMSYNSIVVDQQYINTNNYDGAQINDHGSPRYKPDLIAHHTGSSSYSTPIVCSSAAVLLERINVDSPLSNAYKSFVIKAILMAGATRFNYKLSTEWGDGVSQASIPLFYDGEWERTSDAQPTSYKYGAGALNILTAYNILDAGEFNPDGSDTVSNIGWDYEEGVLAQQEKGYTFNITQASVFSSVLAWHRKINDSLESKLPDYEMTVYDSNDQKVAFSDNVTSNIELIETPLQPGKYRLKVKLKSTDGLANASYGLAWVTKKVAPHVENIQVTNWDLSWDLGESNNTSDYKYRLIISDDTNFTNILNDFYLDNNSYSYANELEEDLYFKVLTYPKDGDVAYTYPSSRAVQDGLTENLVTIEFVCPTNFVLVPALEGYTTDDFCVMKYEAKNDGSGNAISQASDRPYVDINRADSITACQNMGSGYDLMTNDEWQTLARNIELVPSNWSTNNVGTGSLNQGHADDAPAYNLAASSDDNKACEGTGQTCDSKTWNSQRRTHTLSNGEVIWDVSGNVQERVKDDNRVSYGSNAYLSQITTTSHSTSGSLSGGTTTTSRVAKNQFGPSGNYSSLNSGTHGGLGYGELNTNSGAIVRGNRRGAGLDAGIFTVNLGFSAAFEGIGFRCVFHK